MFANIVDLLVKKHSHYMRGYAKYKATLKKEKPENNENFIETE